MEYMTGTIFHWKYLKNEIFEIVIETGSKIFYCLFYLDIFF